jgi:hypothetical protein
MYHSRDIISQFRRQSDYLVCPDWFWLFVYLAAITDNANDIVYRKIPFNPDQFRLASCPITMSSFDQVTEGKTQRGKTKIKYRDHWYILDKKRISGREYWMCQYPKCEGRMKTSGNGQFLATRDHSCGSSMLSSSSKDSWKEKAVQKV